MLDPPTVCPRDNWTWMGKVVSHQLYGAPFVVAIVVVVDHALQNLLVHGFICVFPTQHCKLASGDGAPPLTVKIGETTHRSWASHEVARVAKLRSVRNTPRLRYG